MVGMRLLVLGGTVFLSRAVAAEAVARGHEVTCAARGRSGDVAAGARLVVWDRDDPVPEDLACTQFDAVADVARRPSQVRSAVAVWPEAHWVFVSTVNVYADDSTPGGRPESLPLHDPAHEDVEVDSSPTAYGAMKVACEEIVRDGTTSHTILRPGLIVGPGDPTGRFSYWPWRLSRPAANEVLAPGSPEDAVQIVDVRDLASWVVELAEHRPGGVYDAVGEPTMIGDLLTAVAEGVNADPTFVWTDQDFLVAQDVAPWMGDRSVPLWLPRPEYDGMLAHDVDPPIAAGLRLRPIAQTARDTLDWLEGEETPALTGLSLEEESDLLATWHTRPTTP